MTIGTSQADKHGGIKMISSIVMLAFIVGAAIWLRFRKKKRG